MSTKTMKILTFVATALLVVSIGATTVFGAEPLLPGSITPSVAEGSTSEIQKIGGNIIGLLQSVGSVLAVAIIAILGIKYMMGSAEEKADYKKTMIPYFVGAICIFVAPQLAKMVYNLVNGLQ